MLPTRQGSVRLFRLAGIDIYLHWSWFIVAVLGISWRNREYTSLAWNILEYLALFAIVLLHELGHAVACRQVGGRADTIVLWPLGGVAYVSPPPRPGPILWSIAAGPLVNILLAPLLIAATIGTWETPWAVAHPNFVSFIRALCFINLAILIFNLLPIYPLDGGQIVRALAWFVVGRARSQLITVIIGFGGAAALLAFAVWSGSFWIGILSAFILMNCWQGFRHAQALFRADQLPRHSAFRCPECHEAPFRGPFWKCGHCSAVFDTFEHCATCPGCGSRFDSTSCPQCGRAHPFGQWIPGARQ